MLKSQSRQRRMVGTHHSHLVVANPHRLGIPEDRIDPRVKYRTHVNRGKDYAAIRRRRTAEAGNIQQFLRDNPQIAPHIKR